MAELNDAVASANDFNVPFSSLKSWEFSWDKYTTRCINKEALQVLFQSVNDELLADNQPGFTKDDESSVQKALNFVMKHKERFTISEFIAVLEHSQLAFQDLMTASYLDYTLTIRNDHAEMRSRTIAIEVENKKILDENKTNQHKLLKQDQAMKTMISQHEELKNELEKLKIQSQNLLNQNSQAQNVQAQNAQVSNSNPIQPSNQNNQFGTWNNNNSSSTNQTQSQPSNLGTSTFGGAAFTNFGGNASAIPTFGAPPQPNAPPHLPHMQQNVGRGQAAEDRLNNTLDKLTFAMDQKINRVKITVDPPIYDEKVHLSMLSFGARKYAMWAIKQSLSIKESTLFFCLCFSKRVQQEHVQNLSKDEFGNPRYNTLPPLINQVIKDLKFHEEDIDMQKDKFTNFHINQSADMDDEFLRLFELRKMGWPEEDETYILTATKPRFMRALNIRSNGLHNLVFQRSFSDRWQNCLEYFSLSVQLREMESRYKNNPSSRSSGGYGSNPSPTNATTKMDTSKNIDGCFMNNYEDNKEFRNPPADAQNKQVNAIADRKCRNPACGKTFTPEKIQYSCCGIEFVDAWKLVRGPRKQKSNKKSSSKKPGEKAYNNIEHGSDVNNNHDGGQVSDNFYTAPTHIYTPKCNIPYIVHNALLDRGAGPTLMKYSLLEKIGLVHLLSQSVDNSILGGDQRPLKGMRGVVKLEIALEDSTGSFTKKFLQTILVYDNLNNDLVVGRDSWRNGCRQVTMFPGLNKILIDPSINTLKSYRCDL